MIAAIDVAVARIGDDFNCGGGGGGIQPLNVSWTTLYEIQPWLDEWI